MLNSDYFLLKKLILDSVGPLAKTIDDIVLTYSAMNERNDIYDNVVSKSYDPSKLTVRIITNFMEAFEKEKFGLYIDSKLPPLIAQARERLNKTGVRIELVTLSDKDLTEWTNIYSNLLLPNQNCVYTCIPLAYNSYFNNETRYPKGSTSSPVKSFKEFYNNPLLSKFWVGKF